MKLRFFPLFLMFLCLVFSAKAQVINVENQRGSAQKKRWRGKIDLAGAFNQNTQKVWQGSIATQVKFKEKRHMAIAFGEYDIVRSGLSNPLNQGFGHLRYNYNLKDSGKVILESFVQYQYNEVQKIQLRQLYGAGLRFHLLRKKRWDIAVGITGMYEYERIADVKVPHQDIRSSNYLSLKFETKKVLLSNVTYYQPLYANFSDYRIASNTSFRVALSKSFDVTLTLEYLHDNAPPLGVPLDIYAIKQGLSFNF